MCIVSGLTGRKIVKAFAFNLKARATTTDEKIEPTVYISDLYSVLGVSSSATQTDIKQAYRSLTAQYHPDRNNSVEALCIFRNASYAYQVLKDNKSRAAYDSELRTTEYVTILEEVGSKVLKPLAVEVALPLLNYTLRGIGNFAIPFLKDTMETSNTVIQEGKFMKALNSDIAC